jgi:hypothetical protein
LRSPSASLPDIYRWTPVFKYFVYLPLLFYWLFFFAPPPPSPTLTPFLDSTGWTTTSF